MRNLLKGAADDGWKVRQVTSWHSPLFQASQEEMCDILGLCNRNTVFNISLLVLFKVEMSLKRDFLRKLAPLANSVTCQLFCQLRFTFEHVYQWVTTTKEKNSSPWQWLGDSGSSERPAVSLPYSPKSKWGTSQASVMGSKTPSSRQNIYPHRAVMIMMLFYYWLSFVFS